MIVGKGQIAVTSISIGFDSLPILDGSRLKGFADNKLNVAQVMVLRFERVENIVVTSIFSFCHNVLKKLLPQGR